MQCLLILGRQPSLGMAELESLYGPEKLKPVGEQAVIVDVDPCLLAFDRLGGSIKFCKLLTEIDTTNWKQIENYLVKVSPKHSESMPEGKMLLGLSLIGFDIGVRQIEATGLTIKKAIRQTGRSVRLIPNKSAELNSAQVIHNKLTSLNGWELVLIKSGSTTLIAQTIKVQDIESYTRRDRERPMRDSKVGMLPPKLAQILLNLGSGEIPQETLRNICDIPANTPIPAPILNKTVLDPFCGTGVVLQEALIMGYKAYGTDLEQRMVEYSQKNITWLEKHFPINQNNSIFETADATNYEWSQEFDFIASETYLGRPFTSKPTPEILAQTVSDVNLILKKFLNNIYGQIKPGTRLALAVPAWQTRPNQFKHLPLIDSLSDLGYNRVSFEHIRDDQLIYFRPDQTVARQLIVITRK